MAESKRPAQPAQTDRTAPTAMSQPLMWLVLGIPAATVVAGLVTLWIAANGSDVPVASYYAKQGLSVAPDTSREDRARAIGFSGRLDTRIEDDVLHIALTLHPGSPGHAGSAPAETARAAGTTLDGTMASSSSTAGTEGTASTDPRRIRLLHPSNPQDDMSIHLQRAEDGQWKASQPVTWANGTRWNIVIEGDDWRLPLPGLQAVSHLEHYPIDTRLQQQPPATPAGAATRQDNPG